MRCALSTHPAVSGRQDPLTVTFATGPWEIPIQRCRARSSTSWSRGTFCTRPRANVSTERGFITHRIRFSRGAWTIWMNRFWPPVDFQDRVLRRCATTRPASTSRSFHPRLFSEAGLRAYLWGIPRKALSLSRAAPKPRAPPAQVAKLSAGRPLRNDSARKHPQGARAHGPLVD